ncbi:unnamed protein product, partial [Tetraodon nigroviridis]
RPPVQAPEGEDLDAPRGHFHQRLPVCACQSRSSLVPGGGLFPGPGGRLLRELSRPDR